MIVCLSGILVFLVFFAKSNPQSRFVFWVETIALIAFGISWLTKGGTLYPDKKIKISVKSVAESE